MSIIDYHRPASRGRLLLGERVDWIENSPRAAYIRRCVLSYPFWTKRKDMKALWRKARKMEKWTGVPHVLDHIIPLKHPRVCGLTVPENIQVISWRQNLYKGNSWCDGQGDLFVEPEQLQLDI